MRSIALILLIAGVTSVTSASAQSNPEAPAGLPTSANAAANAKELDCTVSGQVIALAASVPIRNALVTLHDSDDRTRTPVTIRSDADGKFRFNGIVAGHYSLTVVRHGYVTQEYGQRTSDGPGATLTLTPGQNMKDLLFRLVPSATIAGHIQDEDGEPIAWARVTALRYIYKKGKRTFVNETIIATNDLGEYRLFGLRPGRYFISAFYHPGASHYEEWDGEDVADSLKENYVLTYYPGTYDSSKAQAITIKSGEEIPSVDFAMRPTAVYRVKGRVINNIPDTKKKNTDSIMVFLQPRGGVTQMNSMTFDANNSVKKDGTFSLAPVPPGSYAVTAQYYDGDKMHGVSTNLEVNNADVESIQLVISKGSAVPGRVHWEGRPSLSGDDDLFVMGRTENLSEFGNAFARVEPDGSFLWTEIPDGTARVTVAGLGKDAYLKAVDYDGLNVLDQGFTPHPGSNAAIEVTLSSLSAHLQGAVVDADGLPAVGVWVVLVPDAHRDRHDLYKPVHTDQHGQFKVDGITPGDYLLLSWDEVEDGAWEDPDFLKPFEQKAEKVSVQEGDTKTENLISIKTVTQDQAKP
jgi:protocatechuate 3,4-dioxygenase beta subunit